MKIKAKTLREGQPIIKGTLYQLFSSRTVVFEEEETQDVVNITYNLQNGQYGIYGNEYKNPFAGDENEKKADILILVVDEKENKFASWIVDAKKSIGGKDRIFRLIEQLLTSIKHKNALSVYLADFEEEEHIGYVTSCLRTERITDIIEEKKKYIDSETENLQKVSKLMGITIQRKLLDEKAKLKLLVDFSNNCIYEGNKRHKLEYFEAEVQGEKQVCNILASV